MDNATVLYYKIWTELPLVVLEYLEKRMYTPVLSGVIYGEDGMGMGTFLVVRLISNGEILIQASSGSLFSPVKLPEGIELAVRSIIFDEILPSFDLHVEVQTLFWNITTGDVLEWY
jgi:hypothetical protein